MAKTDPYCLRHHAQRSAFDADQAEFSAIKNGSSVVDEGIYDDRIASAMDDFDPEGVQVNSPWHEEDLRQDEAVGRIQEEVLRRTDTLGETYPFVHENGTLIHRQSDDLVYEFLLAICNANTITAGKSVELPRFFERLSAKLVAAYFGPETESIHTGWPRDPEIGLTFRDAMRTVAERTGEWVWGPVADLPSEPVPGDSGCDFVVWPPAADGRKIGQLFVLGQCACGKDWESKWNDMNLPKLRKWFSEPYLFDPVRSFATPHYVTDALLKEASREAGLVFDRARLVRISSRASSELIDQDMREKMIALIDLVCRPSYQTSGNDSATA